MAIKKITITQDEFGVVQTTPENLDNFPAAILMLATAIHALHSVHDQALRTGMAGQEDQERIRSLERIS